MKASERRWTADEIARMNALYRQGWSLREIAVMLGRTYEATLAQRCVSGSSQKGLRRRIPSEHKAWYERMRRVLGRERAQKELRKLLAA